MDRFYVAAEGATRGTDPVNLIPVAIDSQLNRRTFWESLNNFHHTI